MSTLRKPMNEIEWGLVDALPLRVWWGPWGFDTRPVTFGGSQGFRCEYQQDILHHVAVEGNGLGDFWVVGIDGAGSSKYFEDPTSAMELAERLFAETAAVKP